MLAVANFHYIRKEFDSDYPSIFGVTPRQFENQLKVLSKQGKFIAQAELLDLEKHSKEDNLLLITFDDGLKEQYELAKPILDRMGIPFICFINTSNFTEKKVSLVHKIHLLRSRIDPMELEKGISKNYSFQLNEEERNKAHVHYNYDPPAVARLKYLLNFKIDNSDLKQIIEPLFKENFNEHRMAKDLYMEVDQLKDLWNGGSLGSHGHNHDPLGLIENEDVEKDLKNTQDFFISNFGEQARLLSYPYGSYEACAGLSQAMEQAGFKLAFTMERAVNYHISKNPFLVARYDCNDLPGGKADLFKGKSLFENCVFAKWHTYENSTFNQ